MTLLKMYIKTLKAEQCTNRAGFTVGGLIGKYYGSPRLKKSRNSISPKIFDQVLNTFIPLRWLCSAIRWLWISIPVGQIWHKTELHAAH